MLRLLICQCIWVSILIQTIQAFRNWSPYCKDMSNFITRLPTEVSDIVCNIQTKMLKPKTVIVNCSFIIHKCC